jgi:hypothetical protein
VLCEAIFARVVRDHPEKPARPESIAKKGQRSFKRFELVVHGDADGLEQARKVPRTHARPERAADRIDEIVAYVHRLTVAATHDFPSEAVGLWLVSVVAKNVG